MKRLILILIFVFLISLNYVHASHIIFNEGFEETAANTNFTMGSGATVGDGMGRVEGVGGMINVRKLINLSTNTNNFSCDFQMNMTGVPNTAAWLNLKSNNVTGNDANRMWYGSSDGTNLLINDNDHLTRNVTLFAQSSTIRNVTFQFFLNMSLVVFVDGVYKGTSESLTASSTTGGNFTYFAYFAQSGQGAIDNFTCYNGTTKAEPAVADTTLPVVNASFNTTIFNIYTVVNFSANITDETALSTANITYNLSGVLTKINFTVSGTSSNIYNVTALNTAGVFNFTAYVTDSSNNVKQNSTLITVLDNVLPIVNTTFNITSPKINYVINFTANVTDETGLSTANITYNMSATTNGAGVLTKVNFTLSGTSAQISNATSITCGRGCVINFTMYVTDSSNNVKQNSTLITVTNTNPTIPSIINATDKSTNKNETINWSCTDSDSENILSTVWFSGAYFSTSDFNFTTNMINDGVYYLNVSCADATTNSSNSTAWNITLDTSTPSYPTGLPANGTAYNSNRNITVTCSDSNIFEMNVSIYNITSGVQKMVSSNTTINLTPAYTSYSANFSLNASWGEGSYNFTTWCGDTKNKDKKMPDTVKFGKEKSDKDKNNFNTFVFNNTGLQINISVFVNKTKLEHPKDNQNLEVNITLVNNDFFKLVIAYDIAEVNQTTILNFTSNQKIIEVKDGLATHLLFGSGKNRLSYDSQDAVNNFTMNVIQGTESYVVEYKPKSFIAKGDRLVIDPRQDNLNNVEISNIQVVDLTPPVINSLNLTNNTFTNSRIINITYNVSDALGNNKTIILYVNSISNETRSYTNNIFQNISVNLTDGNWTIFISANDTAGNYVNSSTRTIVVDTKIPTFVNAFNRSVTDNSTTITTATKVNLTVFGTDDLYLDRGNFSENCTLTNRSWINHSISIIDNRTTYFNVLENTNFSAGQVCGWKFYFYDIAGNLLDPIYTAEIGGVGNGGGGDSGGGDETTIVTSGTGGSSGSSSGESGAISTKPPIEAFVPQVWLTEQSTPINLLLYRNNTLYDPLKIEFEFKPDKKNIIYENLTKNSIGNYTASFYVFSSADEGKYSIIIKVTSSPTETKEISFEIKKSNPIVGFAKERVQDVQRIVEKVAGSNKEEFTGWQIGLLIGGIILTILFLIMFGIMLSKMGSKEKSKPEYTKRYY